MENQYGIDVVNKFGIFIEDEDIDPNDVIEQQEEIKKALKEQARKEAARAKSAGKGKKSSSLKQTGPAKEEQAKPASDNRGQGQQGRRDDRPRSSRGGPGGGRVQDNRPPRYRREGEQQKNFDGDSEQPRRQNRPRYNNYEGGEEVGEDGRGRGGGFRRGSRGGRGGPGGPRTVGRRDFDRHSGSDKTGVKATDKRDGAGPHNWGTTGDDIKEYEAGKEGVNTESPEKKKDWAEQVEDAENAEEGAENKENAPEDAGPKEMTLDEYKAQQAAARSTKTEFNIRKANEGSETKFSDYKMIKKQPIQEERQDGDDDLDLEQSRPKNDIAVGFFFQDTHQQQQRGGGRGRGGDRRGGRGGRGGGGFGRGQGRQEDGGFTRPPRDDRPPREEQRAPKPRGGYRADRAPRIDNEEEFPSLG